MEYPKKLIEVALPLDDINVEAAREKSIRHGHPSTMHLWWARRPLAAARAVLFAQLVNDPGGQRGWDSRKGITKEKARKERERLFDIIRDLVKWENTNNEEILEKARAEIRKSWAETCKITGEDPSKLPAFHDPFAGGGSIPLEAQRLGLEAYASDLNPVAVLINKAMIEIPPNFAGRAPIGPLPTGDSQSEMAREWPGAAGLAEDVRRYGAWMREKALAKIGNLYPPMQAIQEKDGTWRHATAKEIAEDQKLTKQDKNGKVQELTVIAWLWARTVNSPTPAFRGIPVPLIKSYWLSTKKGKEAWIEPVIKGTKYHFEVRYGKPKDSAAVTAGTKLSRGANFQCLLSGVPIAPEYIKAEGRARRMGTIMLAVIAEGPKERVFLSTTLSASKAAESAKPKWQPVEELPNDPRNFWTVNYGLTTFGSLFTQRQLTALTTFSELVSETREKIFQDARSKPSAENDRIEETEYADAVALYLALAVGRSANYWSSLTPWGGEFIVQTFGRQSLPMIWDFAEANPFSSSTGNWSGALEWIQRTLKTSIPARGSGIASQDDAQTQSVTNGKVVSTDPPYYDNIEYAALSDYFYVWLRRTLRPFFPDIFATVTTPKEQELVANPYRQGDKDKAEKFFLSGMTRALHNIAVQAHKATPITIYYAFKQSETEDIGTASTGWEIFLTAILEAGLAVTGTWPMRTERDQGLKTGTNVLASSIILVCRPRATDVNTVYRRQFLRELEETMPEALAEMIQGVDGRSPVAPVDLAQAAIGPGMAVFSKYAAVLEADGKPMTVHTALTLINKAIDEYFTQAESDMDADTRFCVDWFQQYGFKSADFGQADVLARAKGTSVEGAESSGVLETGGGKVRLNRMSEYPADWNPQEDKRVPVWEACHQMCRALQSSEAAAGELLARMPDKAEPIRQLAYRLYTICERKGWAEDAGIYNALVTSWHAILESSREAAARSPVQRDLL